MHALANVGLVWAVAVLGALFMTTSAQGQHDDGHPLSSASADAQSAAVSVTSGDAPRTAGLALALVVLGGGVIVLAIGASRGDRGDRDVQREVRHRGRSLPPTSRSPWASACWPDPAERPGPQRDPGRRPGGGGGI